MSQILFYVVARRVFNEPFIFEFLFGDYTQDTESRHYAIPFPSDDVARFSKNIAAFPKIIGGHSLVVSRGLKETIESLVDAKWRTAEIAEPFVYPWEGKNGFELFDEYHERQMERCLATGKSEHECDMSQTNDPTLAYYDLVNEYMTTSFVSETDYFELVAAHSTNMINNGDFDDVVAMDFDVVPVKFVTATQDWSKWFSMELLVKHNILKLKSDLFAISPKVFGLMDNCFERSYYEVHEIRKSDYPIVVA
ncbi:MAG: hypothetical protein GY880_04370 [Planctomycetaceae bacterium]|nr:hypothetical protein [Planctomycetaceae bacterium]MCP4477093.1 hypothetical protein [Planctomycetaceae bacterium]MCP4773452.1 hypothetical protein [Planctomycetaceae bacterium]MDG1513908.1 hypothetical protein [Mariniblastus sp.]